MQVVKYAYINSLERKKKMNSSNPIILLSYINTKLRDDYKDLDELCEDLKIDKDELEKKLNGIGYFYNKELNQFK